MKPRKYEQSCSVARFLDRLGSRWTLLIIRDLLIGPRRYTELLDGLGGVGNNLLSGRLQDLQAIDVIEKTHDPEQRADVYQLTDKGRALEPVILSMARWGMQYESGYKSGQRHRSDLLVVAFRAAFIPQQAEGLDLRGEFRIDDTIFTISVQAGTIATRLGPATDPAFIFATDGGTFEQMVAGELELSVALQEEKLTILGSRNDCEAMLACFQAAA